ncbi:phage tail tape measure protein [Yersinia enterocolitica]|uniref:phage tail tape measure protein n=1 Tax=Yersinia enterocolitica TaxID=630 RepID=UPI002813C9CD|nr:phage tail tape measure protein [Yersinia enterocolitica]EKN3597026.1 phage tail tape measure protein [Yersinia enterocolitica]EKN4899752.1 phage tail tape measure protein [Yersinia enterocolitica]HDL6752564.1 phage tail tape measure protein [Yersinia enterocolitica]HDL7879077.1 phage tail tape measure protein [Yersinia enterocolitica]
MADIATISLRADTSSLEQGDKALDHFGQTAEKATKQTDGLNESNTKLASSYDEAAKSLANNYKATTDYNESVERSAKASKTATVTIEDQKAGLNALLERIKPTNKAFAELDEISKKLSAAKDSNLIDSEQFEHYNSILLTTADKLNKVADALTEEGRAATAQAAADRKAAEAKEAFLAKLRDQNALFKASASDSATYRAAQLGITSEAAPMIASIRQQEEATRRDAEQKKLASIAARGLKDSIKQLEAEERAATQATKAQEAADISAAAAKANFVQRLREQVELQGKTASEVQAYKAAQMGVTEQAAPFIARLKEQEDAWKKGTVSAGQYRMAMRQLPMQFTDIATSIAGGMPLYMIAIQQGGQIKDSFGGIGNALKAMASLITPTTILLGGATAAVAAMGYAYFQAEKQNSAFNKAIITTGGYSGVTASQLKDMAYNISQSGSVYSDTAEALTKLTAAGVKTSVNLQDAGKSIVEFSRYSGQSIDDLVGQFARLSDDPVGGSVALTEKLHYLTAAQYQHIAALAEEGNTAQAVTAATEALSGAMAQRAAEIKNSMGTLPSFFDEIGKSASKMWDGIWGLGRDPSEAEARAKLVAKIGFAENDPRRANGGSPTVSNETLSQWKAELASLDAVEKKQTNISQINQEAIKAQQEVNKLIQQGLTSAEKREKGEKELNRWIEANKKAHAEDATVALFTEAEIAKARAGIEKQNKDPKTPKTKAYQDDAATKALLDSQARVAALREQATVTLTMTDQEKQLAKFTQQIADLKSKTILTADQKSLLARSGEITASMQLEAQLSRENVERKKATEALKKMEEYTASIAAKNKQNQDRFGLTSKQAGRVDQETQLDNTFRKDTKGINDAEQLAKITAEYNKAKAELHVGFEQEDLNEGDWLAGMTQGLEQYGETANNVFSATAQLAQNTMGSMTSMATQMMTTGSANVKQFATNFLTSIVDIINRLLIAQAIQAAMGWMSGGASAGAGALSGTASSASTGAMGMSTSFRAYDVGGYTGDGGKFEPKGVVHGGEFVFTKEATNRIGIDNLYKMMRGYADGGLVSNAVTATAPMLGMQGGGNNITVGIGDVVIMSDSQKENNASNSQDIGAGIQKQLKPAIVATISEQLRIPGTPLWMAMNGNR